MSSLAALKKKKGFFSSFSVSSATSTGLLVLPTRPAVSFLACAVDVDNDDDYDDDNGTAGACNFTDCPEERCDCAAGGVSITSPSSISISLLLVVVVLVL